MKFNFTPLLIAASFCIVSQLSATTTLQFSVAGTARATGFAQNGATDNASVANGLRWGILIDTDNNGFFGTDTYDAPNITASGFLTTGLTKDALAVTTGDYFYTPASLPTTSAQSATAADSAANGGIVSAASAPNVNDGTIPGLTAGDKFAIIWFNPGAPTDGSYFGIYTNSNFVIPSSGTSVSFASNFVGNDPIRTASLTFAAAPEPSRALLLGFGALGLMIRRRRA